MGKSETNEKENQQDVRGQTYGIHNLQIYNREVGTRLVGNETQTWLYSRARIRWGV